MSRSGGRRAAAPLIKDPQRYKVRGRPAAAARANFRRRHRTLCR